MSKRSKRRPKYDIVTRAIKLTLHCFDPDKFSGTKNDITEQKTISWDKKRYHEIENDITGQKTISRDIFCLRHPVIAPIKAQVCDKTVCQQGRCFIFLKHMISVPLPVMIQLMVLSIQQKEHQRPSEHLGC